MKRFCAVLILFFAFCGLADSAYLAQHESSGTPLICNIENLSGCNLVANSSYSKVFGVSLAELGVVFYSLMFIFAALELVFFNQLLRRVIQGLAVIGLLMSLFSTIIQVFYIEALCVYCLASALITVFILICAALIEPLPFKRAVTPLSVPPSLTTPPSA